MVATLKNCIYLCGVKSFGRYGAAAKKQRFLYPCISVNNKRKEWGRSNRPEAFAQKCLTARNAAFYLFKTFEL
jgi:hypothetical protein